MEGAGSWPRGIRAPIGGCPISIQVSGAVAEIFQGKTCWVLAKDYGRGTGRGHSRSPEAFFSHNTNSIYIYICIHIYIYIYVCIHI